MAAATAGSVVLAIALHDATYLFVGAMFFALLLQTGQRIVVDNGSAQRFGLRPVVIDLHTAEVVKSGASWWRELFLCATPFMLQDADGKRLYLESWLWDAATRDVILERSRTGAHV
jgi:hypothetical protein